MFVTRGRSPQCSIDTCNHIAGYWLVRICTLETATLLSILSRFFHPPISSVN